MNSNHDRLCPSPEWAAHLHNDVLPQLTSGVELGSTLLEIGPGPGAATEWLRSRVDKLIAIEIDPVSADKLRERFPATNVEIVTGDATSLPWPNDEFDTVASFTMLHHVPTPQGQNTVLAEALRVLKPGGVLLASDSLPSDGLHGFHIDDTYNPIDPAGLLTRLQTIGYGRIVLDVSYMWTVRAYKPNPAEQWQ